MQDIRQPNRHDPKRRPKVPTSEFPIIRSSSNPTIKRLVRLRDNRARKRQQKVIVDGWRETRRALDADLKLLGIYFSQQSLQAELNESDAVIRRQLFRDARASGLITEVTENLMSKISFGQSPRGVVAEFEQPDRSLGQLAIHLKNREPLILVLDSIEKPGNIGAVFRCADAAGIDAVILTGSGTDLFNPNAIRSSLGAVFTVPAAIASEHEAASFLSDRSIRVLGARVESSQCLWETDLSGPLAVVLGSESGGLGKNWQSLGEKRIAGIRIPMAGSVDSLNVSVSAAVIAFEAARLRRG